MIVEFPALNGTSILTPVGNTVERQGRKNVRAGGWAGVLWHSAFKIQHGCYIHGLTRAGVICIRPEQDEGSQQNQHGEGRGWRGLSPIQGSIDSWLMADGSWGSKFSLRVWLLVGHWHLSFHEIPNAV